MKLKLILAAGLIAGVSSAAFAGESSQQSTEAISQSFKDAKAKERLKENSEESALVTIMDAANADIYNVPASEETDALAYRMTQSPDLTSFIMGTHWSAPADDQDAMKRNALFMLSTSASTAQIIQLKEALK